MFLNTVSFSSFVEARGWLENHGPADCIISVQGQVYFARCGFDICFFADGNPVDKRDNSLWPWNREDLLDLTTEKC